MNWYRSSFLQEPNRRTNVAYAGGEAPGTIVVDPYAKFLYFIEAPGAAIRYPIAVGREGRGFTGTATIARKAEWPGWTPTLSAKPRVRPGRRGSRVYGRNGSAIWIPSTRRVACGCGLLSSLLRETTGSRWPATTPVLDCIRCCNADAAAGLPASGRK